MELQLTTHGKMSQHARCDPGPQVQEGLQGPDGIIWIKSM